MTDSASISGPCVDDERLTGYLEGGLDPAIRVITEAHLVACDRCRVRLAFFVRLLKQEMKPEETAAVQGIQEAWIRSQNDRRIQGNRLSGYRKLKIASGGAVAAILIAVGARAVMDYRVEPRSANEVIHLLLTQSRPFEARMSDQTYLVYNLTRGASDPGVTFGLLAGQMNRLGATTFEMGQFNLLQKDFANAIKYLELAAQESGATPAAYNDLGVAYMESGDPDNRSKAVGEFRRALAAKPDYLPAAFNLATLYQRMGRTEEAETQWKQYLGRESDRAWKDEAKTKLEAIRH